MGFNEGLLLADSLVNKLGSGLEISNHFASLLGQVDAIVIEEPTFQSGQFIIAMIAGVILAFGFQLLLTNLSMAAGVSYVAHSSNGSSSSDSSGGSPIKTIGIAFGVWTLVTVSAALFLACWLAVRLTIYTDPWSGAITGLVIWATYFTLLAWFSSTTVGSLVGSVVKSATNGFQTIVGTATAAIGAKTAGDQVVNTAEAAAAAVRREFTSGLDATGLQNTLQDYLYSLKSGEVDVDAIEKEFERLVGSSEIANVDRDALPQINSEMFEKLLSDRTDLSKEDSRRVAKRLYRTWKNKTSSSSGLGEIMTVVASATGGQLASKGLSEQLGKLVGEVRQQRKQAGSSNDGTEDNAPGGVERVISQGMNTLISMVLAKVDVPDVDAAKIVDQIKSAQSDLLDTASDAAPQPLTGALSSSNIIKADAEDYLRHAYIGELKSAELENAFRNVLYDNEADKAQMKEQLSGFDRQLFTQVLSERGMLTKAEINDISNRLEVIRQTVLKDVIAAEAIGAEKRIRQQLETFFKYSPANELTSGMGDRAFRAIIEDEPLDAARLREKLGSLDSDYIRQFLTGRDDVAAHEVSEHYGQLLDRVIADAEGWDKAAKVRLQQQQQSLEDYLQSTGKPELNPDGIKRDLQKLLNEPNEGVRRMRSRVAQFDRNTVVAALAARPEFSEEEVNQVADSVEKNWNAAMSAPQKITAQAQAKYDEASSAIADYLRSTGKPELSPAGIQRDLQKLVNHPKAGAQAIRYRLSKMDRDTIVQLLAQRQDLSENEINQTIDSLLSGIQKLVKSPRRLARRTKSQAKSQAKSFDTALSDYLSNTNKEALNPDGIKRDLQTLLNDPKLGASKLGDRISQMDDSTMVALLAQRPDMTEAEAAEVVGRIADVRNQVTSQIQNIQQSVESVIDRIFASIRDYLNSLDRPELDYYGIKRDVRTLFDDPNAGFSALSDRLSSFDRNTLMALVTSHDRISERDANRVIDQIESARDGVLHRAQSIEQQIESRLQAVKAQTQQQIEDTKKAAEAAAWWLFGTALISAGFAIWGGLVGVVGDVI